MIESKPKATEKAVNRVTIGLFRLGVVVLVLSLMTANGAASYAKAPAGADGGVVKTSMSVSLASGGDAEIYVVSGGKLHQLDPENGATVWDRWTGTTDKMDITDNESVVLANYTAIEKWDSNGTRVWQNQGWEQGNLGALETLKDEAAVWHAGDTDIYTFNLENGSIRHHDNYAGKGVVKAATSRRDRYYTYEQGSYSDYVYLAYYKHPLTAMDDFIYDSGGMEDALGTSDNYVWAEYPSDGQLHAVQQTNHVFSTQVQFNPDDVGGSDGILFGAHNGSVVRWNILSNSLDRQWKTDIWGDSDPMNVSVDRGRDRVLVANNYDIALLDKDGNVLWTRTFSTPIRDIGMTNGEPVQYNIEGQVIDANNNPIDNATIEVKTAFQTVAGASTNATGYYNVTDVDPGTYEISAWKTGYETVTKTRDVDQDIVLDFLLQKGDTNTLEGNVDDTLGNSLENATVRVLQNGNVVGAAKTDSVGFYSISGIPNGTYEVEASKQGYQTTSVTLTIKNYTTQDFLLARGENLVRGYVSDTEGDPISDVIVWVGRNGSTVTSINTESDGYYEVLVDDGNYTFIYSKSGYQEVEISRNITSNMWLNVTMGNLSLIIEAPRYLSHGSDASYTVWVDNGTDRWEVTGDPNLTLSSSNYNVVGIDTVNFLLTATSNTSINKEVTIRGNYNYSADVNLYDDHTVTVANSTVANLPILPPWWRINAVMSDDTIFALILMIWTAVVGSRWTSSFGGLGFGTIAGIILWYAGYLSVGMMLLSVFLAVFLGMNVAANIDYSVVK